MAEAVSFCDMGEDRIGEEIDLLIDSRSVNASALSRYICIYVERRCMMWRELQTYPRKP